MKTPKLQMSQLIETHNCRDSLKKKEKLKFIKSILVFQLKNDNETRVEINQATNQATRNVSVGARMAR